MRFQKNIARQIMDQGDDYLLAVIGNQPTLLNRRTLTAEQLVAEVRGHGCEETPLDWVLDVSFGKDSDTVGKDNALQSRTFEENRSQPDSSGMRMSVQGYRGPHVAMTSECIVPGVVPQRACSWGSIKAGRFDRPLTGFKRPVTTKTLWPRNLIRHSHIRSHPCYQDSDSNRPGFTSPRLRSHKAGDHTSQC